MALSTGIIKLLLGLGNLAFFLANFIMTIAFAIDITAAMVDPPAIVLIIQLTLLAMTVVFGFGLWITCKRKFILLKIYTLVLAAFVVVQIIALAALATGSGNSDDVANAVLDSVCKATKDTLKTAQEKSPGDAKAAIAKADEASWFCCCPTSCVESTWEPKMWELGLNYTEVQGTAAMTALVQYKWPLLNCPAQFAHPTDSIAEKRASMAFDPSTTKPCDPAAANSDPLPCVKNPAVINAEGINGHLGAAMCGDAEDCPCEGDACKTTGITDATQVGWCGDDDNEVNELLTCGGPKQSTKGPPASGSTCKTSIQCVKTWLSQKIELFAVIMTLFLFLETAMVVGTFKLGLKATSGDGVWYHDSGELTDDMSASDALGDYNKSFK